MPFRNKAKSGTKLIRQSIAALDRAEMGESNWVEGRIMLGHVQPDISDRYAPYSPAYLVNALTFTEGLIDRIEVMVPGAFTGGTSETPAADDQKSA